MPNLMNMTAEQVARAMEIMRIGAQNDAFRAKMVGRGGLDAPAGRWLTSEAIASMGADFTMQAALKIADLTPEDFPPEIDPYGERAMGKAEVQGRVVWFKIDYYDTADLEHGSQDPADPMRTCRVGTLMFPEDY